jgi:hypothetical protein
MLQASDSYIYREINIQIENRLLELVKHLKYLGIWLD